MQGWVPDVRTQWTRAKIIQQNIVSAFKSELGVLQKTKSPKHFSLKSMAEAHFSLSSYHIWTSYVKRERGHILDHCTGQLES